MRHPLSPVQKEIYDFIVEFYKQNDNLNPSLRDIANGQINGQQVIKKRVGRENIRRRIKMLCEKITLKKGFTATLRIGCLKMPSDEEGKAAGNLSALDLMKAMAEVENRAMHKLFGGKQKPAPRPANRDAKLKLTPKAKMVNRMLHMDMSETQIANVMGTTRQSVSQIRSRYELPRKT